MTIIADVITRLKALPAMPGPGPWLHQVEGAAGLATLKPLAASQIPAAFVVLGEERAGGNALIGGVHQAIAMSLVVVLVLPALSAGAADGAPEAIEAAIGRVVAGLVGYRPAGADLEITYRGARLVSVQNNQLWLQATFETGRHVRTESTF